MTEVGTIIAEWTEEPITWGDMSDEEKGALLLAHQRMGVIEVYDPDDDEWVCEEPLWGDDFCYRVKPEPEVKEVVLYGFYSHPTGLVTDVMKSRNDTHAITLPTINNTPIPGTYTSEEGHVIKIEEIE